MKCPICGTENDYNWPLQVDGQIKTGGCQDCWEKQSDREWWRVMRGENDPHMPEPDQSKDTERLKPTWLEYEGY